jgi:hypothetical protein
MRVEPAVIVSFITAEVNVGGLFVTVIPILVVEKRPGASVSLTST